MGKVFAVGVGPGSHDCVTETVKKIIAGADVVVGYEYTLDTISNLVQDKKVHMITMEDQEKTYQQIKKDLSVNKVIGIDELTQYLDKKINLDQAQELISIKTRQYAKRQATWARSRMSSWNKINPIMISDHIKKLKKSALKLDQLT